MHDHHRLVALGPRLPAPVCVDACVGVALLGGGQELRGEDRRRPCARCRTWGHRCATMGWCEWDWSWGGGVIGMAYHAAALAAIEHDLDWDPNDADVVVGTSAGRSWARCCAGACRRRTSPSSAGGRAPVQPAGHRPGPPRPRRVPPGGAHDVPGPTPRLPSPALVTAWLRRPWRLDPVTAVASVIPDGRLDLAEHAGALHELLGSPWPDRELWVRGAAPRPAAGGAGPGHPAPARRGGGGLVRHPRLLQAGGRRRGALHRRRGPLPTNADVLRRRAGPGHHPVAHVRAGSRRAERRVAGPPPRPGQGRGRAGPPPRRRHRHAADRTGARGHRCAGPRLHERRPGGRHRAHRLRRHRRPAAPAAHRTCWPT